MSLWQAFIFLVLGVLVVLLPVTVIALSTSKLAPRARTALLALCGAVVVGLAVVAADIADSISNRLVVDLMLLVGGGAIGFLAGVFAPSRSPDRSDSRIGGHAPSDRGQSLVDGLDAKGK